MAAGVDSPPASRYRGGTMKRLACLLLVSFSLAGCGGVERETPDAIWIRQPFLGIGDPQAAADAHCGKYGKRAVYQGRLGSTNNPVYVPILAYDCR